MSACSTSEPASPTSTPQTCGGIITPDTITCAAVMADRFLLQTPDNATVSLALDNVTITLKGTLYLDRSRSDQITIAALEGTSVIGATHVTRVMRPGAQMTLFLNTNGSEIREISEAPYPYDRRALQNVALDGLPRAISLPQPIPPPPGYTPPPTASPTVTVTVPPVNGATVTPLPTATETPCAPPADWTGEYLVQRGDTLSLIARQFGLDMADLQLGNCIIDANRIRVGQVLALPGGIFPATETPAASAESVFFEAARPTIQAGQCTTVDWQVMGAEVVYFEDELSTPDNSRQVCPTTTANYTLRVVFADGRQENHAITVIVES